MSACNSVQQLPFSRCSDLNLLLPFPMLLSCPSAGGAASVRLAEDVYGPFSGQVTSAARQALRRAVLEADPRLAEALFLCEVRSSTEGSLLWAGQVPKQLLMPQLNCKEVCVSSP